MTVRVLRTVRIHEILLSVKRWACMKFFCQLKGEHTCNSSVSCQISHQRKPRWSVLWFIQIHRKKGEGGGGGACLRLCCLTGEGSSVQPSYQLNFSVSLWGLPHNFMSLIVERSSIEMWLQHKVDRQTLSRHFVNTGADWTCFLHIRVKRWLALTTLSAHWQTV